MSVGGSVSARRRRTPSGEGRRHGHRHCRGRVAGHRGEVQLRGRRRVLRSNLSGDRGVGYRLAGDLYARLGHVKARGDLVGYNFSHGLHAVNGVCWTRGVTRLKAMRSRYLVTDT